MFFRLLYLLFAVGTSQPQSFSKKQLLFQYLYLKHCYIRETNYLQIL
jgi:hypothetical protein